MKINNLKNDIKQLDSLKNYILKDDIGEGNFGKMKLAIYKPTGDEYAIKILNKDTIKQKMKNVDFKENEIITKFHHVNIVNVFELIEDKENYYIVMEYCQKGELFDYIVSNKKLSEDEASIFFYQLINGVNYIHSKEIAHRDLKPENLLLTNKKILKIIDFGLSHEYDGNALLKTKCGSPSYAAPELIKGKQYDGFKIDIWCCGIILYAMVCGYLPFEGETNKELFKSILECNPEYPDNLSKSCKKLLKYILVADPNKRINIEDIKHSDFYLKGKELCKKNYDVNLEELDKNSYTNKNDDNYTDYNKNNIEINSDRKDKEIFINNNKNDNIFTKIEVINDKSNKIIDNNNIKNKENRNINIEDNSINEKNNKLINEKEKKKYEILFGTIKDDDIISKYSNKNSQTNKKNNMNSIVNTFRQKIINNKNHNNNNLLTIKNPEINDDNYNYKYNNILQTESNNIKNIFKLNLNLNKNNDSHSLNKDFQSKYNNRFNKNHKDYKVLETNSNNEYDKILNKSNKKVSINTNTNTNNSSHSHSPNFTIMNNPKANLKLNKKLILDNHYSNNISHINSIKERLNYFTAVNTINNFDLDNINNKSISAKRNKKKIPPIKGDDNIFINSNLYYNDINININNVNINNTNENFIKLNDTNFLQNSDKIKININNINNNENLANYIKFKNNILQKNEKRNSLSVQKTEDKDKTLKENINNISKGENSIIKPKKNLNKIISNLQNNKRKLGKSIDLSNINNNKGILKKKIFKNFYYNNTNESNSANTYLNNNINNESNSANGYLNNNRCNTINNYINNNWYNNNFEKTPKHINIKKNSYINSSGKEKQTKNRINNIIKINNKYELGDDKNKYKKGHKYQIAIKEFLNLVQNSNNNKISNSGNNSPNKDFLPYL